MTPHDFIAKWQDVELTERSASQSHFNDLCALVGVPDPVAADPCGEWFTFEKGVGKTTGGKGWADVWRRGCFAWEYKGPRRDLDRAFAQLQQYAVALENPPLLIVSDTQRFRLHTNWTNTVQETHAFELGDLADGATRDRLRWAFTDPEQLRPRKTRQALTEEAAGRFASLAQRLRARGHDAEVVAHFVNRLVFCMFAEDVGLLPGKMFERMLTHCQASPADFESHAATLFEAMRAGGMVGFERVAWFNGGLFDTADALPLDRNDAAELLAAARLDWSDVDPSILGTLFERGLDPAKRSQLGAHYTDRDKIMQIVGPVVEEPLLAEWAEARAGIEAALAREAEARAERERTRSPAKAGALTRRAEAARAEAEGLHRGFIERLVAFRVLDPACGSGNFLYLALLALKGIEHRANLEAEALGLPRGFPQVGPESVLGIEINPFAAELARVSVWVGEIQWMRRNGFDAARNPILRPLDTIECRDAVLAPDGDRAEWPEANAVVGNPPFLGDRMMRGELGDGYVDALRGTYKGGVPAGADFVLYWVAKGADALRAGRAKRVGFVTTNSVRGGMNRRVLDPIADDPGFIAAWDDEPWTVAGAAVRVSMIAFGALREGEVPRLNGEPVARINANLTASAVDLTRAKKLKANRGVCVHGSKKIGSFDIGGMEARALLQEPINPNGLTNAEVLSPVWNGADVLRRPTDRWIIDFGMSMSEADAALFEKPFAIVSERVKPDRMKNRNPVLVENWWLHGGPRPAMRNVLPRLSRCIATPAVAKHRIFLFVPKGVLPDAQLMVVLRDDDTTFGVLHSRFHELWALRMGTSLEDRPRYTPSTTFETFPFPDGLTPDRPASAYADDTRAQAIAEAARTLDARREAWLNPPDLVERVPEVVPGYPDRLIPVDEAAARELKRRTLTNLYNARPAWLAHAHATLDAAVATAYGWEAVWAGGMDDDAILARLFALNQERAAAQG